MLLAARLLVLTVLRRLFSFDPVTALRLLIALCTASVRMTACFFCAHVLRLIVRLMHVC